MEQWLVEVELKPTSVLVEADNAEDARRKAMEVVRREGRRPAGTGRAVPVDATERTIAEFDAD